MISDVAGCLFLLLELEAGENSFFAPYISMLPSPPKLHTSHYWSLARFRPLVLFLAVVATTRVSLQSSARCVLGCESVRVHVCMCGPVVV